MKRKYQEHVTYNAGVNKAIETYFEMIHILDVVDNELKAAMLI